MLSDLMSLLLKTHNVYQMLGIFVLIIAYTILVNPDELKHKNSYLSVKKLLYKHIDIQRDIKSYKFMFYIILFFLIIISIILIYLINYKEWAYLIAYGLLFMAYIFLFYKMINYPHLFKKDYFPSYKKDGQIFIVLTTISNKLLVVSVSSNELNKHKDKIYNISLKDKRYIIDYSQIVHYGIKYVKNDILQTKDNDI